MSFSQKNFPICQNCSNLAWFLRIKREKNKKIYTKCLNKTEL